MFGANGFGRLGAPSKAGVPAEPSPIPADALYEDDGATVLYADDGTTVLEEA